MYQAQESLHSSSCCNLPEPLGFLDSCACLHLPARADLQGSPADDLSKKIVELVTTSGEARERLSQYAYTTLEPGNPLGLLQEALELAETNAPLEKRLRQAQKEGLIKSEYLGEQIDEAASAEVISKAEAATLRDYHDKVFALLSVDDFDPSELGRQGTAPTSAEPVRKAAKRKAAPRTKTAKKKTTSNKKASKKKTT